MTDDQAIYGVLTKCDNIQIHSPWTIGNKIDRDHRQIEPSTKLIKYTKEKQVTFSYEKLMQRIIVYVYIFVIKIECNKIKQNNI